MSEPWKVLIVDDEMLIRQGVINYINWDDEGFQIIGEAGNGNEALQLMEQNLPHIILTDVVMPGMDGIELVKRVKEKYPAIEIVVLSSFENFEYVRSTFQSGVADYILKPKLNGEELLKTLHRIVPSELEDSGTKQNPDSIEEILQKGIKGYTSMNNSALVEAFPFSQYSIVAVWREDKDNQLSDKEIINYFQEHIENLEIFWIPIYESGAAYILNFEPALLKTIKQVVATLAEQYNNADMNTRWMMIRPFPSISKLKEVYEEDLLVMANYYFYLSDRKLLLYDELPKIEDDHKHFELSQFIDFFKHKQFTVAIHYLTEHVQALGSNYTKDTYEFKSWLENIVFNIIVLLGNMKYDSAELESKKYDYFTEINEAKNASSALFYFLDFVSEVKKIVLSDEETLPTNMQLLLQYIEEHYAEPLSLKTLSNHFHFNASYLSSYFSSHYPEGFSEYLNHVRINKAKTILKSSTAQIATVSEQVGYSDQSYFSKVFKRLEGKSPGNYRKEVQMPVTCRSLS
ncbi:response regulator [Radiobacillus sp. PE A8.2]|uniref:response regulator n=1 Tax=Radiobacillus sp. PE A8.2 TaxID=3380349 RepID=UPI00388EEBBB